MSLENKLRKYQAEVQRLRALERSRDLSAVDALYSYSLRLLDESYEGQRRAIWERSGDITTDMLNLRARWAEDRCQIEAAYRCARKL